MKSTAGTTTRRGLLLAAVVAATVAGPGLGAQQRVDAPDLPEDVARSVVEAFNDEATLRLSAPAWIPPGSVVTGDVGVLGGPLTVAGEIRGGVIVVNGDVRFRGDGRIRGDVVVIGGGVSGAGPASVEGTLVVYGESLAYRRSGDHIEIAEPRGRRRLLRTDLGPGNSHLTVRAGTAYNRIEGLPVILGPIVQSRGDDPFRFEGLGVWRTENGLSLDAEELGYRIRAEQRFGWSPRLAVGATVHSEVRPIERWGLSDLEASLATFFFHRDYRDHVDREGWSLYARAEVPSAGLEVTAEYVDEKHGFAAVGSPWTLTRNDDPWRPQALVGTGDFRSVTASILHDGRNDPADATDGWFALGRLSRLVSGDLTLPAYTAPEGPVADERVPVPSAVTSAFVDVRRYLRVSPDADLALRVVGGGALGGTPLPPQLQHALGGEGSLPGYRPFTVDCGARERTFQVPRMPDEPGDPPVERVFAAYGCDRALLFQARYRGHLFLDLDFLGGDDDEEIWDEGWDWYPAVDLSPSWVVFTNVGRGWVVDSRRWGIPGLDRRDSPTLVDVGFGLYFGDLGLLWAFPLQGDDRTLNFFVRLGRRF